MPPRIQPSEPREATGQRNLSVSNFGLLEGPTSPLAIDAAGGPEYARQFLAAAATLNNPIGRVVRARSDGQQSPAE